MGNSKSSKKNTLLRVGAVAAVCAVTAGVIGAGTLARYSSQFGADGLEDDGSGHTRGARAAAFHFTGQYAKDGGEFTDATGNLSLFSSMYKSSDGKGTTTDNDDVTVKADQQVVAPGTNGALSLKMSAGANASDNKKCYAETDTIVKLNVSQLETGVYSDVSDGSQIPIVYKVNNKYYVSSESNLEKGHTYVFSNGGTATPSQSVVTIDGYLDDLAKDNAYYYKAKDKFYKLDGTEYTYTAADKAHIVDAVDTTPEVDGVTDLTLTLDWIWNYQNLGDITAYVTAYKADNNGASTADAITAFKAESAATKATYLTEASAHANDAFDTRLGEAAFARAAGGTNTDSDIQLAVNVDATQVD